MARWGAPGCRLIRERAFVLICHGRKSSLLSALATGPARLAGRAPQARIGSYGGGYGVIHGWRQRRWRTMAAVMAGWMIAAVAGAVETKVIRDDTFDEFNRGESTGTEILAQGRLRAAPTLKRLALTEESLAWKAVADRGDGSVFFCTGNNGKVFRLTPDGKSEVWADLEEVQATALAIDATGGVLIGATPGGKIYRVVERGKPQLFFETGEQYVWDLIFDRQGLLYAATGPDGRIWRIRGERNGEIFYDSDATNILALGFDSEGRLLAAGQGRGLVLRVDKPEQAYVLYASADDEVKALAVDSRGAIYAAVNVVRPGQTGSAPAEPLPSGSAAAAAAQSASPVAGLVLTERALASLTMPVMRGQAAARARVVLIQPNGFVSDFWQAPEGPIRAMLAEPGGDSILVAAGDRGRIYRLFPDATYSKLGETDEPMVVSLTAYEKRIFATTANKAAVYELGPGARESGTFVSRPLNAGSTVKWGNLVVETEPLGTTEGLKIETRSGNTPEPDDKAWSRWSSCEPSGAGMWRVASPVAQYVQYRLTLPTGLRVDSVHVFYVPQNVPPVVSDLLIEKAGAPARTDAARRGTAQPTPTPAPAAGGTGGGGAAGASAAGDVTDPLASMLRAVTGTRSALSERRPAEAGPEPAEGDGVGLTQNQRKLNISWKATDPNNDALRYSLWVKAEDETKWRLVEENLSATKHTVPTDFVGDGEYRFRVDASDAVANPADTATTGSATSAIVIIDNTAPVIERLEAKSLGSGEFEVEAAVSDSTSLIGSAQYVVDVQKEPSPAAPEDGLFDAKRELFKIRVRPDKPAPEHVFTFRVLDREGNAAVGRILLK
ncbi:MAG: hypothetical protein N2111_10150 [Candidatus Sumerlaeaceae bacterium]|nr:hypothetical protein [Candidatus Sumerlaeaceae bacterium]